MGSSADCRRLNSSATAAVASKVRPMPIKLAKGPRESAAHPNPAMPAIAVDIPPVLNVVKTRPSSRSGVSS